MPHCPRPVIVVAVDGSPSSHRAVTWAAAEAGLHHCELHIVTSMAIRTDSGYVTPPSDFGRRWLYERGRVITHEAHLVAQAVDRSLVTSVEVTFAPVSPAVIARSTRARMVVVGRRGPGGIRLGGLGSVSAPVVRGAHCPVGVVGAEVALDGLPRAGPVVVGVDGGGNSVAAVRAAFDEAARRQVDLVAVHACGDDARRAAAVLAENIAGFGGRYPEVRVRRVVDADSAAHSLLAESARAQLLVIGSHGRGPLAGLVFGSTSKALLRAARLPVLVARPRAA
ncbi:universal stress protein [Nocardia sp. SSK8]|uniref:universal stress protein n=1 Tax=Nocardia sp. SSK8 TaxID=3120154 RepID=UPI0030092AC2